jgi:hypothetical protein
MATKKRKKAAKKRHPKKRKAARKAPKKRKAKKARRTPKLSGAQLSKYRALKNQLKREFYASVK